MILKRTYTDRAQIPKGAEQLYVKHGALFIMTGAKRDFVADNPWAADAWNLTDQMRFVAAHGIDLSIAFAHNAGTQVGALKPSPFRPDPVKVLIQKRVTNIGGGGSSDSGSSGDGPPA